MLIADNQTVIHRIDSVSLLQYILRPVHTGDKVEFNTVDFVVDRVALAPYTLATKSTATRCRIHVVADLLPKPATKLNVYGNSRLCCQFVAGFGHSRLSTKSTVLNSTLSPVCTGL